MNNDETCKHCQRPIQEDDGIWYHVESMQSRCNGADDEPGIAWSDLIRQAEPMQDRSVKPQADRVEHARYAQSLMLQASLYATR